MVKQSMMSDTIDSISSVFEDKWNFCLFQLLIKMSDFNASYVSIVQLNRMNSWLGSVIDVDVLFTQ